MNSIKTIHITNYTPSPKLNLKFKHKAIILFKAVNIYYVTVRIEMLRENEDLKLKEILLTSASDDGIRLRIA